MKKKKPVVLKRSAEWYEINKPLELKYLKDSPIIASLRKMENEIKVAVLGPSEYLDGLVESFNVSFNGDRLSIDLRFSVEHGGKVSVNHVITPSIIVNREKVRIIGQRVKGNNVVRSRTFSTYSPDCTPEDIIGFLAKEIRPLARGVASEFVAFSYFKHIAKENPWLTSVRFSDQREDSIAVDLFVQVDLGNGLVDVPVQVKSSQIGQVSHIKRGAEKGLTVPSVVVINNFSSRKFFRNLIRLLFEYALNGNAVHV